MTHVNGLLPGALARGQVRETARATAALVARQIQVPQVLGATVTAAVPTTGIVSVHLDGDPAGQSVQLASASWELYDVGQRVLVQLAPPSFAYLLGPVGPPAVWTPYTPTWTVDANSAPTITALGSHESATGKPSVGNRMRNTSITLTAGTVIYVVTATSKNDGTVGGGFASANRTTPPAVTSVSCIAGGITLAFYRLGGVTKNNFFSSPNEFAGAIEVWMAYVTTGGSGVEIAAYFDDNVFGWMHVIEAAGAKPNQSGAAFATASGAAGSITASLTTTATQSWVQGMILAQGGLTPVAGAGNSTAGKLDYSDDNGTFGGVGQHATSWREFKSAATSGSGTSVTINDTVVTTDWIEVVWEILGAPSAPTIGNGTLRGSYRVRGKSMDLRVHILAGSTTTFGGTGNFTVALPAGFTASALPASVPQIIPGVLRPAGTNYYRVEGIIDPGASFFKVVYADGGTQLWDATHPVSFASTGWLTLEGTIEIA